ncbi:MAG: DUF4136 domain-containing protein [Caldithrix sp.]|nr:MAG: DUF4136 domain-containing protein [Caldithrix sp.]
MKNTKVVLGLVLVTGLISCSGRLVRSDYDREINFARLKTFDWKSESEYSGSNGLAKNSLFEKRLRKAVEAELAAKRLSKQANNPDFLIAYSIAVEDKVDVRSDRFGYGYGHGYWHGYSGFGYRSRYYGFGYGSGYYNNGGLYGYQYKEATLILDFIDPASNELLWRGLYIDEVDDSGIITEDKIHEAVKHILEKFPPENSSVGTTNLLTSK